MVACRATVFGHGPQPWSARNWPRPLGSQSQLLARYKVATTQNATEHGTSHGQYLVAERSRCSVASRASGSGSSISHLKPAWFETTQPCSSIFPSRIELLGPAKAAGIACMLTVLAYTQPAYAEQTDTLSAENPVYDAARLVASERQEKLAQQLVVLEQETGWRVRVLTRYGPGTGPSDKALREAWKPDSQTAVIMFDPSAPNLISYPYLGDNVLQFLKRQFWVELQTRYGNLFYVREQGEQRAVEETVDALQTCFSRPDGCGVVPGLPSEQYGLTALLSAAGGLLVGFASKLEPQGRVQSSWGWVLLFSPLWLTLFVNFGLGPIIARTSDALPIMGNVAVFAGAAALPYLLTFLLKPPSQQQQQQ